MQSIAKNRKSASFGSFWKQKKRKAGVSKINNWYFIGQKLPKMIKNYLYWSTNSVAIAKAQ